MTRWWTMKNAAGDPTVGELSIYGPIGSDGSLGSWLFDELTPASFKAELDELGNIQTLNVMINSPGGDVFAGQAIHSMLVRHPAVVNVYIDGLAASTASLVAMAGDQVIMPRNAMLMIHDPYVDEGGNAREHRQMADALDVVRESMIAAYQRKSELSHDELVALLEAETWMTAEQAVSRGFADQIEASQAVTAAQLRPGVLAVNGLEMDLTHYRAVPERWGAEPRRDDAAAASLTKRDAERALVAAGAPRAFAKAIVHSGYPSGGPAEPEPSEATPESEMLPAVTAEDGQRLNPLRLNYTRSLIAGSLAGAGGMK